MNSEDKGEYFGVKYEAVDDDTGECHRCLWFSKAPCIDKPPCTSKHRKDKRNVIYVEVLE